MYQKKKSNIKPFHAKNLANSFAIESGPGVAEATETVELLAQAAPGSRSDSRIPMQSTQ